jgi:hypothetical protein
MIEDRAVTEAEVVTKPSPMRCWLLSASLYNYSIS